MAELVNHVAWNPNFVFDSRNCKTNKKKNIRSEQRNKKTRYVCLNGAGEAHSKGKGAQKGTHPLNTQKKGSKGRLINPV